MRCWRLLPLLVLLLPAADAGLAIGSPTVTGMPVVVDTGRGDLTFPVTFTCSSTEAMPQGGVLSFDAPSAPRGLTVSGRLSGWQVPASACAGPASQAWRTNVTFAVAASGEAAGEKPQAFTVHGHVRGSDGSAAEAWDGEATAPAEVAYFGLLTVSVPTAQQQGAPGARLDYAVTLTNLGNAATSVGFTLDAPLADRWSLQLPDPVVVGPSARSGGAGDTATVHLLVTLPQGRALSDGEQPIRVLVHGASTVQPDAKAPVVAVNLLARVESCSLACPRGNTLPAAVAPLVALLLLACGAVARRRIA